jgi:hypothetical protein
MTQARALACHPVIMITVTVTATVTVGVTGPGTVTP